MPQRPLLAPARLDSTAIELRSTSVAVTESSVLAALQSVVDPNTGKDFVSARCVKNLRIAGDTVDQDVKSAAIQSVPA